MTFPARSLLYIRLYPDLNDSVQVGCDCSTVTIWTIEGVDRLTEPSKQPFTCDGCNSVTWFTVKPRSTASCEERP